MMAYGCDIRVERLASSVLVGRPPPAPGSSNTPHPTLHHALRPVLSAPYSAHIVPTPCLHPALQKVGSAPLWSGAASAFSSVLLFILELSDTQVYAP